MWTLGVTPRDAVALAHFERGIDLVPFDQSDGAATSTESLLRVGTLCVLFFLVLPLFLLL